MDSISIIGCGWLGLPLGRLLVEKGYAVKGSTTRVEKLQVLQSYQIKPFLIRLSPEGIQGEQLANFFQSNLLVVNIPPGRRRTEVASEHPKEMGYLIEKAVQGGVKKVLFISSTGVYADANRMMTELDIPQARTVSGQALMAVEAMLQREKTFETTILRMAGLVGGERKAGRFLAGKTEVTNGDAPVNLVHCDDCLEVIYEVIRQEKWGKIFNVCADEHPTRRDFYTAQAQKQGFIPPQFRAENAPQFKIISNHKIKKELDYTFLHADPMQF